VLGLCKLWTREEKVWVLQVALCDDDKNVHPQLQAFFFKLSAHLSCQFEIHSFASGEELLQYYKNHGRYVFDILILDIEMGGSTVCKPPTAFDLSRTGMYRLFF